MREDGKVLLELADHYSFSYLQNMWSGSFNNNNPVLLTCQHLNVYKLKLYFKKATKQVIPVLFRHSSRPKIET